jgi:beta-galactosidase
LTVDRPEIRSRVRDVAHVTVEVVDANGVVVPDADDVVEFTVEGAGRLLAVGNGDPTDHDPYQAARRRAFHGMLLAMIQSGDRTGTIRVTARAEGLGPMSTVITVVPEGGAPRVR